MKHLDDLWRDLMAVQFEKAYGIQDEPTITFAEFYSPGTVSGCEIRGGDSTKSARVTALFKALCADEISVPVFDVTPGTRLSRFFAVEPNLAP